MRATDGALALDLRFEPDGETVEVRKPLKLAVASAPARLQGPDKYRVLEHRRRQAQIKARRLLELAEG
jgi:hypothetical protein